MVGTRVHILKYITRLSFVVLRRNHIYVFDYYFILASSPNEIMVTIDIFSIPHLDEKLEVSFKENVQILAVIISLTCLSL